MKKILLSIMLFAAASSLLFSQNYRAIEWDVLGISRLMPTGDIGTAAGLYTEARCNVNDRISVGLKFDWQFFDGQYTEPIRGLGISTGFAFTGDYYLYNNVNRRAFAGLGIGSCNGTAKTELGEDIGGSGFRIVPRVGYELGFLIRLTAAYNQSFEESVPSYFDISIGLNLGGRSKGSE